MKRAAACLLAFCLAIQGPFSTVSVYGANLPAGQEAGVKIASSNNADNPGQGDTAAEGEKNGPEDKEQADNNPEKSTMAEHESESPVGAIRVEIRDVLRLERAFDLEVSLYSENAGGGIVNRSNQVSLGQDSVSETSLFEELLPGEYTLAVKSEGYETYIQNIKVNGRTYSVTLMNDYLTGSYSYEKGQKHPGVLKLGDIDGSGKADEEDLDRLLQALAESGEEKRDPFCDLNGDGMVDLRDLQYFTMFYKNSLDSQASVMITANITDEDVTASASNASISGDAASLFTNSAEKSGVTISADKKIDVSSPVSLDVTLDNAPVAGALTIAPIPGSNNRITAGAVVIHDKDGTKTEYSFGAAVKQSRAMFRSVPAAANPVSIEADGTIVINLGGQVAVKKVTILITDTSDPDKKLAEISKVEFLNGMEDRIAPPVMNIPEKVTAEPGSASFQVSWKKTANVTGYEVKVEEKEAEPGQELQSQTFKTTANQLKVTTLNNEKLENNKVYLVSVQSVNGDWRSGYSVPIEVMPRPVSRPDAPESVSITGGYRKLSVTWKDMKDTDGYTLYYREAADKKAEYTAVEGIETNAVVIDGLKDETQYEIYLTGYNEMGTSGPSKHYVGTTTSLNPPVTPNYKLINVPVEAQAATAHVEKITDASGNNNMDFAMADNDYGTAWVRNDWDAGVIYPGNGIGKSPIITFDEPYEMDTIVIIPDDVQSYSYKDYSVFYWEEGGKAQKAEGSLSQKRGSNGKIYYEYQTREPISPKRIQVNFSTGYGRRISIAEIKFYYYDSLEQEVDALFGDEMHITLAEGVTEDSVSSLRERLNQTDSVSGEFHPKKQYLENELDTVEILLRDGEIKGVISIDTAVTKAADKAISFKGGLNAWQPLGVTAMAGDTVTIYVGSPGKKIGDAASLKIVATQYHGESGSWQKTGFQQLKVGQNQITIPKLTDLLTEQGGQLYIEYTGEPSREQYAVRVSGGSKIPVLDVTKATDSNARMEAITEYVEELEAAKAGLESEHGALHGDQDYDRKNCILGATDIVLPYMMYSVSSSQILAGLTGSSVQEKAAQLDEALQSMEDMLYLFYQHKGLSKDEAAGSNRLPVSRLNIRYQRMFAGAFMYAGGLHIGIEWGSIPGLSGSPNVSAGADGRYKEGRHFGWGIAHEIGHEINEGTYAIAEITNNYFSVLAQAKDTNDSVRFQYQKVYDKVTSGVVGRDSNVFTQLGLYWQLHLAYDKGGYNYKTYDGYQDQLANLFFARVDTYARNTSLAPSPKNVKLSLKNADVDNSLMRLACASAEKNLLEFFRRWGMVPNEETVRYAEQFEKEERAVWFVNDEARVYEMEHGSGGSVADEVTVSGALSYTGNSNAVKLTLTNNAKEPEAMLGYEIYRTEMVKGRQVKTPVGFVEAAAGKEPAVFMDVISTVNNRTFGYEIVGYDKYLRSTKPGTVEPVKVSHGGNVSKDGWTVTTNMVSDMDDKEGNEGDPDVLPKTAVMGTVDGDISTVYTGSSAGEAPYIIINLNQEEAVTGLVYTLDASADQKPIGQYTIEISDDGTNWTKVKAGTFALTAGDDGHSRAVVYFNQKDKDGKPDKWLYTYDTSYIKLTAPKQMNQQLSIGELDVLGNTGDNVELLEDGIGILKEDYEAGTGENGTIPKGSLIFTGTYQGNPAYNTVLLFDENGNIVGGVGADGSLEASQIIFADVPENGDLGETSDGIWIYYIEPELAKKMVMPIQVRAELYRTDNAHTNQGERLVSNTLFVYMPEYMPEISLRQ